MKVGLLVSRSGPAGLWAPSSDAGAMLAAAQINAAGGVLGSPIELVVGDAGWSETEAIAAAAALVDVGGVDAVVGMHPSNVREAIRRQLFGRVPYIYTPQYEGGEHSPYTIATGGTDDEMLGPAIAWLTEQRRARRFFLVGNDYVWPRTAHKRADRIIVDAGGSVVGNVLLPFGLTDYTDTFAAIRRARPDVVILTLLGSEAVGFNRAFSKAGLAAKILRFGLATDETVLYAIGPEHTENLYAGLNYFSHIPTSANGSFLEAYHDCFGDHAPPVNVFCQSCYDGVQFVANLAASVGRSDGTALARSVRQPVGRKAARSSVQRTPMGDTLKVYIARAEGLEFRTVTTW